MQRSNGRKPGKNGTRNSKADFPFPGAESKKQLFWIATGSQNKTGFMHRSKRKRIFRFIPSRQSRIDSRGIPIRKQKPVFTSLQEKPMEEFRSPEPEQNYPDHRTSGIDS
jgi:hypothetical protein